MKFQVTNAADGYVLWRAETKLVLDRDGSYFDENCNDRGICCGSEAMHTILSSFLPQRFAVPRVPYGVIEIDVTLGLVREMPKEHWPK